MTPPGYLTQLRAWVVSYLQTFPDFVSALPGYAPLTTFASPGVVSVVGNVPQSAFFPKVRGNLVSQVSEAVGRVGICAAVSIDSFLDSNSQTIEATLNPIYFSVIVAESPEPNATQPTGTGWDSLTFCERIIAALKQTNPPQSIVGGIYPIYLGKKGVVNIATDIESLQGLDIWACNFEAKCTTDARATP